MVIRYSDIIVTQHEIPKQTHTNENTNTHTPHARTMDTRTHTHRTKPSKHSLTVQVGCLKQR